jgi:hypothetical protein
MRALLPLGASELRLHTDDRVVWEKYCEVVKPSEMIVVDIPWEKIGSAREIRFTVAPVLEEREQKDEPAAEGTA